MSAERLFSASREPWPHISGQDSLCLASIVRGCAASRLRSFQLDTAPLCFCACLGLSSSVRALAACVLASWLAGTFFSFPQPFQRFSRATLLPQRDLSRAALCVSPLGRACMCFASQSWLACLPSIPLVASLRRIACMLSAWRYPSSLRPCLRAAAWVYAVIRCSQSRHSASDNDAPRLR